MSLKCVLKVLAGFSKHVLKMKLANFKISKKKDKKYKPKTKIMLILRLFCRLVEISGQKYFGFENFQYFTKRTPNKKKG